MKAGALTPAFLFARGLFYFATSLRVMPALVAGIHAKSAQGAAWMAGTSPAMTGVGSSAKQSQARGV
jgi:hypothetical protein